MWRWPTIAHKKAANAQEKAKIISLHAKLIALEAKNGSDIQMNPRLHEALVAAKKAGVSAEVIDRAIARWSGSNKDDALVEEIIYEGYGAYGIAVIVRAITDNRNRTAPNMRRIFSQNGGSLGESGSISRHQFDFFGYIRFDFWNTPLDILELDLLNLPIHDYRLQEDQGEILFAREHYGEMRKSDFFQKYTILESGSTYEARIETEIVDENIAIAYCKLLQDLEEDEDVEQVWTSAHCKESLMEQAQQALESRRFRT
jgi:YebC/PmpR family DNA-binding regulatory protein